MLEPDPLMLDSSLHKGPDAKKKWHFYDIFGDVCTLVVCLQLEFHSRICIPVYVAVDVDVKIKWPQAQAIYHWPTVWHFDTKTRSCKSIDFTRFTILTIVQVDDPRLELWSFLLLLLRWPIFRDRAHHFLP